MLTKEKIEAVLKDAYNKFKDLKEGKNADYIKELANVDPNIFGIALVTTDGQVYTMGDVTSMVSIQSVSKVFTMAKVLEEQGPGSTGQDRCRCNRHALQLYCSSRIAKRERKSIPLLTRGAIASTSLVNGADSAAKWKSILAMSTAILPAVHFL